MVWVPRPHTFSFQRFEAWARGPWPSLCEGLSRRTFSRVRTDLMPINQRRLLQVVAILGALFAYATIVVGGTVRGLDAGLACNDWPLCNGSVVPNLANTKVLVDYVRYQLGRRHDPPCARDRDARRGPHRRARLAVVSEGLTGPLRRGITRRR